MKTGEEKGTRTILFYQIIKLIILEYFDCYIGNKNCLLDGIYCVKLYLIILNKTLGTSRSLITFPICNRIIIIIIIQLIESNILI